MLDDGEDQLPEELLAWQQASSRLQADQLSPSPAQAPQLADPLDLLKVICRAFAGQAYAAFIE